MSKKQTFEFEVPDNMSHAEQWPYIFSQMFMHFDNDCMWVNDSQNKAVAVKVVETVCKANLKRIENSLGIYAIGD